MEKATRRVLIGESVGHAVHDAWFGLAPVLFAALSSQIKLSNSDIALAILFYQLVSSATQPIFGRLSERFGGRPFAVGAILWTTLMFSLIIIAPSKMMLMACTGLAGFGSGAWHPQGTVNSTIAGGKRWGATAASVFFFGGTIGNAILGAALGGFLIETFDRQSLLVISAITITLSLTVVRAMVPKHLAVQDADHVRQQAAVSGSKQRGFWLMVAFLLVGIALRSLAHFSLNTFVPKYEQDLGATPALYGLLMSLFLSGNAIGGVIGAYLADRVGMRNVLAGSLILGGLFTYLYLQTTGVVSYAALGLAGAFIGPSHTLFVVSGQRRFPERMATVSGLFLGFIFVSGSGGTWLLGLLADRIGSLGPVLAVAPWALVVSALAAFIAVPHGVPAHMRAEPEPVQ